MRPDSSAVTTAVRKVRNLSASQCLPCALVRNSVLPISRNRPILRHFSSRDKPKSSNSLSNPIMAGMPEKAAIFADGSPVFDPQEGFKGTVLARYAETGSPLLSGYLIGEKYLQGKAAALDVPVESGHVVLIGFRPEWRGQPFGTFRVLFNAVLNMH